MWRTAYEVGLWKVGLPNPNEALMPEALKGVSPVLVMKNLPYGATTEDMGHSLMVEGILAAKGEDSQALGNGLSLMKSWLSMVNGPEQVVQPFAGGTNKNGSASDVGFWPYGASAIEKGPFYNTAPAGVPAWRFPIETTSEKSIAASEGSMTNADEDAIFGMVYLAGALSHPGDFVDMVIRSIIAFASADLGFPDLYRVLPDGTKIFVPKLGSMIGGLTPEKGNLKTKWAPWCYAPGNFAPAHYRTFRDFTRTHWKEAYDMYLPKHSNGSSSSVDDLLETFDSAVTAGYNILRHASCGTGAVADVVGVEAACKDGNKEGLHCAGVPWAHTPAVGWDNKIEKCQLEGMTWGSFGSSGSKAVWRVAMDYVLFPEEASSVVMYDRFGLKDEDSNFGAPEFLNRVTAQYQRMSACDGGAPGACTGPAQALQKPLGVFAGAFDDRNRGAVCENVPESPEAWTPALAFSTFTAFVAPTSEGAYAQSAWMDSIASLGTFSEPSKTRQDLMMLGKTAIIQYPEVQQAMISTMVMSGQLLRLSEVRGSEDVGQSIYNHDDHKIGYEFVVAKHEVVAAVRTIKPSLIIAVAAAATIVAALIMVSQRRRKLRGDAEAFSAATLIPAEHLEAEAEE